MDIIWLQEESFTCRLEGNVLLLNYLTINKRDTHNLSNIIRKTFKVRIMHPLLKYTRLQENKTNGVHKTLYFTDSVYDHTSQVCFQQCLYK